MKKDARVDAYIAKAAPFARPILEHVRSVVHAACPDGIETIKWGMPAFEYKGPLVGMAAFKAHCTVGFWKASLIPGIGAMTDREAMGHFGRITSVKQLPSKRALAGYVKAGMALNDEGVKVVRKKAAKKPPAKAPADLAAALARNKRAQATYDAFSPSHKREYIEWLTEAKRPETRAKRLAQAIEWMAEGKPRMWKYMRK